MCERQYREEVGQNRRVGHAESKAFVPCHASLSLVRRTSRIEDAGQETAGLKVINPVLVRPLLRGRGPQQNGTVHQRIVVAAFE
jgi:hypothetical protein